MRSILRQWTAFAALGAGLVHVALGAGTPDALGVSMITAGVVELGWAVLVLARGRIIAPRATLVGAVVLVAAWPALILVGAGWSIPPLPMLAAVVLDALVAAFAVALQRSGERPAREPSAALTLVGMFAGALLVAGLATPALAATPAGGGDMGGMHASVPTGHHG